MPGLNQTREAWPGGRGEAIVIVIVIVTETNLMVVDSRDEF